MTLEEGRKVVAAESKEKNVEGEPITFKENNSFKFSKVFPHKPPNLGGFSIPCVVETVKIERALCDLGATLSLMLYSMFHKHHLGPLEPAPISLQLADGSETQPLITLEDVPKNRRFFCARRFYHYRYD